MWDRAVFLDRDNTIIENDGYLGDPAKVKLLQGAGTALVAMRALGYRLIVVSNQSGVARGMFDEAAVEAVNQEMSRQLQEQAGAYVDASYYCPYHPDAPLAEYRADHDWRKPLPGMLKQAATDFGLDLAQSWMIGDQNRDIGAGAAAGCRTILLRDPDLRAATETDSSTVSPSFVVRTLADAARILAREGRTPPPAAMSESSAPGLSVSDTGQRTPSGPTNSALPSSPSEQTPPAAMPTAPARAAADDDHAPPRSALLLASTTVAGPPSASHLERTLDELVIQLRQQNRQADFRPDSDKANMAAVIVECLAITALVLGLNAYMHAPNNFTPTTAWGDYFIAEFARQGAITWLLVGVILQGMVVALLIRARNKH